MNPLRTSALLLLLTVSTACAATSTTTEDDGAAAAAAEEQALRTSLKLETISRFTHPKFDALSSVVLDQFESDTWGEIGGADRLHVKGSGVLTAAEGMAAVRAAARRQYMSRVTPTSMPVTTDAENQLFLEEAGVYFGNPAYAPERTTLLAALRPVASNPDVRAFALHVARVPRVALIDLRAREILIFGGGSPDD